MKKTLLFLSLLFIIQIGISQVGMHFDGTNDYIQTSYRGVTAGNDRTFEAWILIDTGAPTSNLCILDYGSNNAYSRNTFMVNGSRRLAFFSGNANLSAPANAIPVNTWTHVAFVLSSGTGYLYINGVQVGTGSLAGVYSPLVGENVKIGQRVAGGNLPFNGNIDEVRIWDVARTAAQITADMNAEFCSLPANLTAYYRLNEGSASGTNTAITSVTDDAGTNNGVINGFALTGTSSNYVTGANLTPGFSKFTYKDSLCNPYTTTGGKTFSTTGVYYDTLSNSVSCDSLIVYDLFFTSVNDSIYQSGNDLISYDTWANHQWIDCNNGNAPITGENSDDFTPTNTGSYAVIVSKGSCSDTSDCISVVINHAGINENSINSYFELYPNPTSSVITIKNIENKNIIGLSILDVTGKTVLNRTNNITSKVNVELLENGVYFMKVMTEEGAATIKFIKN